VIDAVFCPRTVVLVGNARIREDAVQGTTLDVAFITRPTLKTTLSVNTLSLLVATTVHLQLTLINVSTHLRETRRRKGREM
jgi:hypothetical protein